MPLIRKKTSKRTTTHRREKIKHKIVAHRKKARKQAKKDAAAGKTQKKSKKDPGIPNAYPYKDEILAEIAQQRREAAAEKQRRRAEKRATASAARDDEADETGSHASHSAEGDEQHQINIGEIDGRGFDGVTSLKTQPLALPRITHNNNGGEPKEEASDVPVYPGPSSLRKVLAKADVVVCVVDARDPEAGISEALIEEAKGKAVIVLANKADLVPRESLAAWLAHLRTQYTTVAFRASSQFVQSCTPYEPPAKKMKVRPMDDAVGPQALWTHLKNVASAKSGDAELVVAVTGVANSGKSAVINSLLGADALPIYNVHSDATQLPYTTTTAQEVVTSMPGDEGLKVRFVDTPGLEFARQEYADSDERQASRARDILLRCRGRIERLKDPLFAITHIISRAETQDLMLAYNLAAFPAGDGTAFLAGVARVHGLVKSRGVLDHAGAARIVLRDWNGGKLVRYTMPPVGAASSVTDNDEVLAGSKTRRELRKEAKVGLVRLIPGEKDGREVLLDVEWTAEDGDGKEKVSCESEDDDEDDDDEEAPELLQPPSPPATKKKRKVTFAVSKGKRRRGE